jgi:hypothetical protein
MSGEHYVSAAILRAVSQAEKAVRVSGLKCVPSGETRAIGIKNLVGNILCNHHNEQLSPFDAAGLAFFKAMEHIMVPGSPVAPLQVSGDQLERWMLETLVGGLYCGQFPTPEGINSKDECPPTEILRILFESDPFPTSCGLYLCHGKDGAEFLMDHEVLKLAVLPGFVNGNLHILGLQMWVFGIEFFLSTFPLTPMPEHLQSERATYRPTHITGSAGETLVLDWEGNTECRGVAFTGRNFQFVTEQ